MEKKQKGFQKGCNWGYIHKKHGMRQSRLYRTWSHMKERCQNKNCKSYKNYGGRGISICDEWKNDFINFYNWAMANGYQDDLTIDRIDVNGNYEPDNCRWITMEEQAKNKRNKILYNGYNMENLQNITGLKYGTLYRRIKTGRNYVINNEKFQTKHYKEKLYSFNGKNKTLTEWSKILNIKRDTLYQRIEKRGWSIERAFTSFVNN